MALSRASVRNLRTLIRPHAGLFLLGSLFLVLGTIVNLAVPGILREVLNEHGISFIHSHLMAVAFGIVGIFALQSLCFYGRSYLFGYLGQKVAAELRSSLYEATIRQSVDFFDATRTADLVSRITADTSAIQDAISIRLSVIIRYALQVVLGVILMAVISWFLTLIVIASLLLLVGISFVLGKRLRTISRAQQGALGAAAVVAQETFGGIRVVKGFDRESRELRRFGSRNDEVLQLGLSRTRVSSFFQSFVSFLLNTALALLVLYGVVQVSEGDVPAGDLTAFLAYGAIVAVSFSFIAGSFAELMQSMGATERVFEVLNTPAVPATRGKAVSIPSGPGAELTFDAVSFAYPSRAEVTVLSALSFTVGRGKTVALVGPSGAGKSTIVNLLLRFYDPSSGHILINGVDLRDVAPEQLRKAISFVPQEPELFGISIADNLRYGKSDATQAELEQVCARAGMLEFIRALPRGFETIVGERGAQLSGGQKQRLAIARAMLRDPEVLILDEATSALDSENEALVQRALAEVLKGRTALVIAHRLSTIKGADLVIVLEGGRIAQVGTHDALSQQPGLYRTLVERQELKGAA